MVMTEAITKKIIKNGNIFLIEKLFPAALFSFLALYTARTRVIGIIASVRVSLTMGRAVQGVRARVHTVPTPKPPP